MKPSISQLQRENKKLFNDFQAMERLYISANSAALAWESSSKHIEKRLIEIRDDHDDWRRTAKIAIGGYIFLALCLIALAIYFK